MRVQIGFGAMPGASALGYGILGYADGGSGQGPGSASYLTSPGPLGYLAQQQSASSYSPRSPAGHGLGVKAERSPDNQGASSAWSSSLLGYRPTAAADSQATGSDYHRRPPPPPRYYYPPVPGRRIRDVWNAPARGRTGEVTCGASSHQSPVDESGTLRLASVHDVTGSRGQWRHRRRRRANQRRFYTTPIMISPEHLLLGRGMGVPYAGFWKCHINLSGVTVCV